MTNTAQQKITVLTQIGADELVENAVNKLITIQIARYQTALQQITREKERYAN